MNIPARSASSTMEGLLEESMRSYALVLVLLIVIAACAKPVVFEGRGPIVISGTPPAPPRPEPAPPPRVEVRDNKIEIREKIQFDFDKATIKPESFGLMNEIAAVISTNAHLKRIQIEGHASAEGSARHNKKLSDSRAKAVMQYLTGHGVAPQRPPLPRYRIGAVPIGHSLETMNREEPPGARPYQGETDPRVRRLGEWTPAWTLSLRRDRR